MNTKAYVQLNRLAIAKLTTTKRINKELVSVLTLEQSFTTKNFLKSLGQKGVYYDKRNN